METQHSDLCERLHTTEVERTAKLNRRSDGTPVGIALFLTASELASMGVDPEESEEVGIIIADDSIKLVPIGTGR